MTQVLSKSLAVFDISSGSFVAAARDLGEVLALLAGGVKPDPESLSRLSLSMRQLQGFLLAEAAQQDGREAVAMAVSLPVSSARSLVFSAPPPFELRSPVRGMT